jgi:hypothetical protein
VKRAGVVSRNQDHIPGERPSRVTARHDAVSVRPVDPDLLQAAVAAESRSDFWRGEFQWCLAQQALAPLQGEHGDSEPLRLGSINAQRAHRFPAVSDDPEWLSGRSINVLARRVAPAVAAGDAVCVDLTQLIRGACPAGQSREFLRIVCESLETRFAAALGQYSVTPRRLSFSLRADHPGLTELPRLLSATTLGRPAITIRVPDALLPKLAAEGPQRLWLGVTELAHRDPGVGLVLQGTTRQACLLAAAERADAVLPHSLFEARADTAWLAVRINIAQLRLSARSAGVMSIRRLLRAALRLADNLVDQLDWGSPELRHDAMLNRRLALHIDGIGELVDQCRLDPACIASSRLALRWAGLLRRLMLRESNALARERGPFPGLAIGELEASLSTRYGAARAEQLLRQSRLRHRHILVISPYAVFPVGNARHPLPQYLHLLPVMRCADTVGMYGHGVRGALSLPVFRRLMQMSWAISHNRP